MNKKVFFIVMVYAVLVSGCATDECTNGKCIEDFDLDWGRSSLVALEPNTGEGRWIADFPGERLKIVRLQDDDSSVVVASLDPCFDHPKQRAIALDKDGGFVKIQPGTADAAVLDWCENVSVPGVTTFEEVSGICVGREDATGDVVGVDPSDNSELWRSPINATGIYAFGTVLIAMTEVQVADAVQYRVLRVAAATGNTLWMHPGRNIITPLGANNRFAFFLDTRAFAINLNTGDVAWEYFDAAGDFVPGQDGGELMANTLFVKRQFVLESKCGAGK